MEIILTNNLHIKRVTNPIIDDALISQMNLLFDEETFWDREEGDKFLHNPDNILLLAYWENQAVGFLSGHRLQRFDKRKAEVLLYEVGVQEEFRKKGIAKALIETLKNWAKEVEADEVWVLTNQSNDAGMALYKSAGGTIENTDEQMYTIKV